MIGLTKVFLVVLGLSLTGTVFFLLIWAVHSLGRKKLSKTLSYYLWLLVVLKLLIPFQPDWILGQWSGSADIRPGIGQAQTQNPLWQVSPSVIPTLSGSNQAKPAQMLGVKDHPLAFSKVEHWPLFICKCAALVWLFGLLWTLGHKLRSYRQFQRTLAQSKVQISEKNTLAVFAQISRQSQVQLWQSELIGTPLLMGIRKPLILLPTYMVTSYAKEENGLNMAYI